MNIAIGILLAIVLLVVAIKLFSPKKDWDHLEVDNCGSVCPNSGVCDGCDIGFP